MLRRINSYIRRNIHIIADGDLPSIQNRNIKIREKILPDRNSVAIIAVKRRFNMSFLSDFSKQPAHQILSVFLPVRMCLIVFSGNPLCIIALCY